MVDITVGVVAAVSALVGGLVSAYLQRRSSSEANRVSLFSEQGEQLRAAWVRIEEISASQRDTDRELSALRDELSALRRENERLRRAVRALAQQLRESFGHDAVDVTVFGLSPSILKDDG